MSSTNEKWHEGLNRRVSNALKNFGVQDKETARQLYLEDYKKTSRIPNIGRKLMLDLGRWLSEPLNYDTYNKGCENCIKLLEDNGYKITKKSS